MERREIDYAMSWLSTLGGAFSAMGEQFDYCVRISCLIINIFNDVLLIIHYIMTLLMLIFFS